MATKKQSRRPASVKAKSPRRPAIEPSRVTPPTPGAAPPDVAGRRASRAAETGMQGTAAVLASSGRSTVSGPSLPPDDSIVHGDDVPAAKFAGTGALAEALPSNQNKPLEYGDDAAEAPPGVTAEPPRPEVTGSTLSESNASPKLGPTVPLGVNQNVQPLSAHRADSSDRALTTNQGIAIADNQHSLRVGLRGPALLEDFVLREKITHFDHERIPERVVHARGSAAHGVFECYESLESLTRASIFAEAGKQTPAFVRFSTVAGERGSTDTARDVRGFAVKFYTDEGNWDLVGNNIPVFFIQDAMKFPDLVHAVKPEPHHAMPQASSAHDTFWDFVSLMPESTHMLLWQMSDRAIPRSYRTMQGFGVHTFRFLNAAGETRFVKFHWTPLAGTHSLVWDEAVKISGADPDFHRRDLWEAIEAGEYPEYELGIQVFTEEDAEQWSFDVLDPTKIVPEELVPVQPVGKLTLTRNPDNFFAETEQVAFCTQHVVPGIDFSNDPLLQGRNFSYLDTQLSRLGGPNFHEIPINAPVVGIHNNQRDGFHRQTINRGRVNYEPNSLAGGCPFQAGSAVGFTSFREPVVGDKMHGKPERFADHYTQAELFWNSQTSTEKAHIVNAFRFELTRVQTAAVRERVVAQLRNVAEELGTAVADGLGMPLPEPLPVARPKVETPEVSTSPALSLFARPGTAGVRGRRVAILVADGLDGSATLELHAALASAGAVPRLVGQRLGAVRSNDGEALPVEVTMEAMPCVLFDALVVPGGAAAEVLAGDGHAIDFVKDQYRHCKPLLVVGAGKTLLGLARIPSALPDGEADPGLLVVDDGDVADATPLFLQAIARHRHFERETDPPLV
jgi:catalase